MLYRLVIAIAAFTFSPLASLGENATLEMTTAASLGPNGSIFPSSLSIQLESLSPSVTTYTHLPSVLYSIVNGNNDTNGLIDLDFTLIIGSEILSKSATTDFDVYSHVSGPGANGATASLISQVPIVFGSQLGTFTINYSKAFTNQLGSPTGSSVYAQLELGVLFAPVPEPSSCALAFSSLALLCFRQRRVTVSQP